MKAEQLFIRWRRLATDGPDLYVELHNLDNASTAGRATLQAQMENPGAVRRLCPHR